MVVGRGDICLTQTQLKLTWDAFTCCGRKPGRMHATREGPGWCFYSMVAPRIQVEGISCGGTLHASWKTYHATHPSPTIPHLFTAPCLGATHIKPSTKLTAKRVRRKHPITPLTNVVATHIRGGSPWHVATTKRSIFHLPSFIILLMQQQQQPMQLRLKPCSPCQLWVQRLPYPSPGCPPAAGLGDCPDPG